MVEVLQVDLETALQLNIENARKFERELQATEESFRLREEKRKANIVKSLVSQNVSSPARWFTKKEPLPQVQSLGKTDKAGFLTKQVKKVFMSVNLFFDAKCSARGIG